MFAWKRIFLIDLYDTFETISSLFNEVVENESKIAKIASRGGVIEGDADIVGDVVGCGV